MAKKIKESSLFADWAKNLQEDSDGYDDWSGRPDHDEDIEDSRIFDHGIDTEFSRSTDEYPNADNCGIYGHVWTGGDSGDVRDIRHCSDCGEPAYEDDEELTEGIRNNSCKICGSKDGCLCDEENDDEIKQNKKIDKDKRKKFVKEEKKPAKNGACQSCGNKPDGCLCDSRRDKNIKQNKKISKIEKNLVKESFRKDSKIYHAGLNMDGIILEESNSHPDNSIVRFDNGSVMDVSNQVITLIREKSELEDILRLSGK